MGYGRYETGDRVWVRSGPGPYLPGVVIGLHQDWGLYRVVYVVEVAERGPRAIEEWRLSPRQRDEPPFPKRSDV